MDRETSLPTCHLPHGRDASSPPTGQTCDCCDWTHPLHGRISVQQQLPLIQAFCQRPEDHPMVTGACTHLWGAYMQAYPVQLCTVSSTSKQSIGSRIVGVPQPNLSPGTDEHSSQVTEVGQKHLTTTISADSYLQAPPAGLEVGHHSPFQPLPK